MATEPRFRPGDYAIIAQPRHGSALYAGERVVVDEIEFKSGEIYVWVKRPNGCERFGAMFEWRLELPGPIDYAVTDEGGVV